MSAIQLFFFSLLICVSISLTRNYPVNAAEIIPHHGESSGTEEHKAEEHKAEEHEGEHHNIVVTNPFAQDVTITEQYVCQIRSRRHIKVCAMDSGYLEQVLVNEGQAVKQGDLMFKIIPILYQTRYDAELAEARLAELELKNAERLLKQNVVSSNEVALFAAKVSKARAKAKQAEAELGFTSVTAPFDGIIDRLEQQLGSLIKEGEVLTTLSDNSVMWVYFNVPEARYLAYMATERADQEKRKLELILANGEKFPEIGKIGAIEAQFNNETGNIPFRADFPNPNRLLRHGQTGNVLIHQTEKDAVVIPQRASFEILDKRYVFVVDDKSIVHQREIAIAHELDDIFVIKSGVKTSERIVLEGVRQVKDLEKLERVDFLEPQKALSQLKYRAE